MKKENDTRPATNAPNRPPIRKSTLDTAARGDEMLLVAILPMLLCCCCDSNGTEVKKVPAGMIRRKNKDEEWMESGRTICWLLTRMPAVNQEGGGTVLLLR